MSRLTEPAIQDGDDITAASLNDRFTQFSQPGALNAFNVRDGAFDLPHFKAGNADWLAPDMATDSIGWNEWKHASYHTFTGQTTGSSPHVVLNSVSNPDHLSFGPLGFTLNEDDILRVYWDLSVRPRWEGSQPWEGGALFFTFPKVGGGTDNVFSGYGCWAFWLQWDVTDNTLTNWVDVPSQGDFNSIVTGTRGGNALTDCSSTSVIQSVVETGAICEEGKIGTPVTAPVGWSSVDGAWHYKRALASPLTVYGVRVVFSGPFGAYNDGAKNYLVRNDSVAGSARLDQQAGGIQAIRMRTS